MLEDTMVRNDEFNQDLYEPAYNLQPAQVDQPIPDPVREVVPIGLCQFKPLTLFPEVRRSTRVTQEPD